MSMARAAVPNPARSDTRAPQTRRLSISRPNSSVPRAWPGASGGRRRFAVSTAAGSARGSAGASSAPASARPSTTTAAPAVRFRATSRRAAAPSDRADGAALGASSTPRRAPAAPLASLIPDPGVQVAVEEIHPEVDEGERQGDDEDAALDQREVAGQDP